MTRLPGFGRLARMFRLPGFPLRRSAGLLWLLALWAGPAAAQLSARAVADLGPRAFVITGATVHLGDGSVLEGARVALDGGLIVGVGPDAAAPPGAWELDAAGQHLYPGFVTALGDLGLAHSEVPETAPARGPEDRPLTHSWRRAADDLATDDERIAARLHRGFTSAVVVPGGGIVSGHAAFVNLAATGEVDARDLVLSEDAALMVRLETAGFRSFPGSLMGVIAYLRQLFLDASHYREVRELYESDPAGLPRPRYDRALAPLAAAVAGDQPVLLPANLDKEVRRMTRLALELGLRPVLYGGHEAARSAAFLAERDVPILVNLDWPQAAEDADPEAVVPLRELRLRDRAPAGPAALAAAGVRFAFYGAGRAEDDLAAVRTAVERGLDPEAALTALTLAPAEIFGLDDRVGSIAAGRIANLVIADRSIFEEDARVTTVFVDGVIHHPPATDTEDTDSEGGPR